MNPDYGAQDEEDTKEEEAKDLRGFKFLLSVNIPETNNSIEITETINSVGESTFAIYLVSRDPESEEVTDKTTFYRGKVKPTYYIFNK